MSSGEADAYKPEIKSTSKVVPQWEETASYWYTRYLKLRIAIERADNFLNIIGDPIAAHCEMYNALAEEGVAGYEFQTPPTNESLQK